MILITRREAGILTDEIIRLTHFSPESAQTFLDEVLAGVISSPGQGDGFPPRGPICPDQLGWLIHQVGFLQDIPVTDRLNLMYKLAAIGRESVIATAGSGSASSPG